MNLFSKLVDQEYVVEDLQSIECSLNGFEDLVTFSNSTKCKYYEISIRLFKKLYFKNPKKYGQYILFSCIEVMKVCKMEENYSLGKNVGMDGLTIFLDFHLYNSLSAYFLSLLAELSVLAVFNRDGIIAYMHAINVYETIEKDENNWIVLRKDYFELAKLLVDNDMEQYALKYFMKAKTVNKEQSDAINDWVARISKKSK